MAVPKASNRAMSASKLVRIMTMVLLAAVSPMIKLRGSCAENPTLVDKQQAESPSRVRCRQRLLSYASLRGTECPECDLARRGSAVECLSDSPVPFLPALAFRRSRIAASRDHLSTVSQLSLDELTSMSPNGVTPRLSLR